MRGYPPLDIFTDAARASTSKIALMRWVVMFPWLQMRCSSVVVGRVPSLSLLSSWLVRVCGVNLCGKIVIVISSWMNVMDENVDEDDDDEETFLSWSLKKLWTTLYDGCVDELLISARSVVVDVVVVDAVSVVIVVVVVAVGGSGFGFPSAA